MKTKLLKLALCAMAALPMGAWADIDFGTEKTVSQKTVWNFNSLTAEQEYSTVTEYLNAYLRVTHDSYKISVKATASENITLSDNTVLSVSKVITLKKTNSTSLPPSAATTSQTGFSSSFAFNAAVPGQVIVHFKGKSGGSNNIRVWNNTKSGSAVSYISSNGNIQTLKATVLEKGSYFVCSNGAEGDEVDIYAVEFIPRTAVGAKTLWTFNQYPIALLVGYWYWMNRLLRKKDEELAVARDKAQESSRMKSAFIKNISHEIRTPLNILSGFTQIIAQSDVELPPEVRKVASQYIQENTNRITSLINHLLALSELSSRNSIERSDSISANRLCQEAIRESGIADRPQHQFSFVSSVDDTVMVQTSMRYATSAIVHLLDNAEKFTPDGGSIAVKCDINEKMLRISIEDTGCGIPEDKADTIFDEFVQLDEYKDGVGIGLTLSRNTVRRLGGDIMLDATYNKGARFFMTLPL